MEPQTWLNRHYKFISAENITILSVSSNDFFHAFPEVAEPFYMFFPELQNILHRNKCLVTI